MQDCYQKMHFWLRWTRELRDSQERWLWTILICSSLKHTTGFLWFFGLHKNSKDFIVFHREMLIQDSLKSPFLGLFIVKNYICKAQNHCISKVFQQNPNQVFVLVQADIRYLLIKLHLSFASALVQSPAVQCWTECVRVVSIEGSFEKTILALIFP